MTSVVYEVPLTGSAAPHQMDTTAVKTWGQIEAPSDATAVFPADSVPSGHSGTLLGAADYRRASILYLAASGNQVNSAAPGGHISTTENDRFGNTVRELSASNRAVALGLTAADKAVQEDLGIAQLTGAERAELLSARSVYNAAGTRKLEEFAPLRRIGLTTDLKSGTTLLVPAGTPVTARTWTVNEYDAGRPTDGTATIKDQVTKVTVGAQVREHPATHAEIRQTQNTYDWAKAVQVKTIKDPGGQALTTETVHDAQGRVIKQLQPGSNGADAATRVTTYWSATGTGACAGRPEWVGKVCSTGPAGAITGGGSNPTQLVTTTTEYDWWGNTAKTVESANGVTRTTTTTHDAAGRPAEVAITGGSGATVPQVTITYDPTNGEAVKSASTTGGTITRIYDKLTRLISYTDADGGQTQVQFDALDRPIKVTDSVPSTVTFSYDHTAEPRGLPTKVTDSVAGAFTAVYDADGGVVSETLPGGYTLTQTKDTAGSAVARTYTRDSDGTVVFSDRLSESVHGQVTAQAGWSDQEYTYDTVGRLSTVKDTAETVCNRRAYGFDQRSNRTSLTTATGVPGADCPTAGGTTKTYAYDSADRAADAGWTYDAFGRATAAPGHGTISYYANDLAQQQIANGKRQTWQLDAALRFRSWKVETGSGSTWTQTGAKLNHYDSDGDNPRWIVEDTATGALTRNVETVTGTLGATTGKTGDTVLQLTNIHGDIALQLPLDTSKPPVTLDNDEYGNTRSGQPAVRYGWLGSQQRSAETPTGLMLMGVRLYDPTRGRFMQTDPLYGGSANAYDYSNADPCNATDTDGMFPKCGTRRIKNGYGMRIVTSRRGGGVAKNGYRYMGYYINVQVTGFANRYLAKNASQAETWGVKPGRSGKMVKLQSKKSWYTPLKLQWAVHYNIQVKPGTRIWTGGAVAVFGWRGYVASMTDNCVAK